MTEVVAAGYDAVYSAWSASPQFHEMWARHAVDGEVAVGFEHLNFVRLPELEEMAARLGLEPSGRLVDLACGAGGPGAWIAKRSDASLVGVDLSRVGTRLGCERAHHHGLSAALFTVGSVDRLPLASASVDGVMSVDSLQYVPDKRATFAEVARALRPGGRFVFTAFELNPERVRDVAVLGVDPVPDYSLLLREANFEVQTYEETPGWHERLVAAYSTVIAAEPTLRAEMGNAATDALLLEMAVTLHIEPYPRRVLAVAQRNRGAR